MSDVQSFEDRFASRLRAFAVAGAPTVDRGAVARAVSAGVAERHSSGRRIGTVRGHDVLAGRNRPILGRVALAAAVALGVVLAAALWGERQNQVVSPSESRHPSEMAPSPTTAAAAIWSSALRLERPGQQQVDLVPERVGDVSERYVDIDSVENTGQHRLRNDFRLAAAPPPSAPEGRRVAYGVVIDRDLDGEPDLQAGVESSGTERLVWMTDLSSGETALCECAIAQLIGDDLNVELWHPDELDDGVTGGYAFRRALSGLPLHYYVWASIVEAGAVVANDHAPDSGWLEIAPDVAAGGRANPGQPGPLRPEPVGGAPVVGSAPGPFADPAGDAGAPTVELIDIVNVEFNQGCWMTLTTEACVFFNLAAELPLPLPDPDERWLGYGLVVDTDGDGAGDWRYGMDNAGNDEIQMWWTDLATGTTESAAVGVLEDPNVMDAVLPPQVGSDVAAGHVFVARGADEGFRFYVWASTVSDGTGAVDYAPDTGWLELSATP